MPIVTPCSLDCLAGPQERCVAENRPRAWSSCSAPHPNITPFIRPPALSPGTQNQTTTRHKQSRDPYPSSHPAPAPKPPLPEVYKPKVASTDRRGRVPPPPSSFLHPPTSPPLPPRRPLDRPFVSARPEPHAEDTRARARAPPVAQERGPKAGCRRFRGGQAPRFLRAPAPPSSRRAARSARAWICCTGGE